MSWRTNACWQIKKGRSKLLENIKHACCHGGKDADSDEHICPSSQCYSVVCPRELMSVPQEAHPSCSQYTRKHTLAVHSGICYSQAGSCIQPRCLLPKEWVNKAWVLYGICTFSSSCEWPTGPGDLHHQIIRVKTHIGSQWYNLKMEKNAVGHTYLLGPEPSSVLPYTHGVIETAGQAFIRVVTATLWGHSTL